MSPDPREGLVQASQERADPSRSEAVRGFVEVALRRVPGEQLREAKPARAAQQLVDAFAFVDGRPDGELAVRVFTPDAGLDGWSEPGTVVEVSVEDRPFLLTTVREELVERGYDIVRALHPVFGVRRGASGQIERIVPARGADRRESFMHIELDSQLGSSEATTLAAALERVLGDALAATGDFRQMRDRARAAEREITETAAAAYDPIEISEAVSLIDWLLDDNFVLLGWRDYDISHGRNGPTIEAVAGSGLGILRDHTSSAHADPTPLAELDPQLRERILEGPLITFSRTRSRSTVHRRSRMEYFGIRRVDADGTTVGEHRMLGLFTSKGFSEPAAAVPYLRRKLQLVLEREDVVPGSHDESVIAGLFDALPKDELFQTDPDALHAQLVELASAEETLQTRATVRYDRPSRTASVIVVLPQDRYDPELRHRLTSLLRSRLGGEQIEASVSLGDRAEALVRFAVHEVDEGVAREVGPELQREIVASTRSWADDVARRLVGRRGEAEAHRLQRELVGHLPATYRDSTPVEEAVADVEALDLLVAEEATLRVRLHAPGYSADGGHGLTRVVAYHAGQGLELSGFLPILESLGMTVVEERPHHLEGRELVLHDFGVRDHAGGPIDVEADGERLAEATLAAWDGRFEVDSLNRLVLRAGLTWPEVELLRAYRRYRRQAGTGYSSGYINDALVAHPSVASALLDHFHARFDPERSDADLQTTRAEVLAACDDVERLDHDRILRGFLALVEATVRTNYFAPHRFHAARDGLPYLAIKLDSGRVPDLPRPVPFREIFVFSPAVEGVHLRGGPIARGGLRWSDRQDDVRTEVLGLMKAQMLKNAVIVPTGAKGGFVVKGPVTSDTVRDAYVTFVTALLDLTDNIVEGEVVAPPYVRRHDADDPYLVVAADRGTATFSDTANAVAEGAGFWLGDAFASGGSRGYDHKALGITARGAWVAVRRHFQELDLDVQHDPIRVVGVGDMSGDVFGNGMLQSRSLRIVAAFDHRDVFLDPDPDPERSFEERRRLFDQAASSWQAYDPDAISEGGGVWPRSRKAIPLSRQVQELLRVDAEELPSPELLRAVLRAPVDLLWFGGIGTYVKASTETHDEIGDRANDEIRVDATELRARVVGEGANLAVTQPARIQYARRGGHVNLDAIDNAGGVNISDREVNLKVLLRLAEEQGRIDREERDELLRGVTDDVVAQVLRDQELQTWRLSQETQDSPTLLESYEAFIARQEDRELLSREVEALPTTDQIDERAEAGAGLTRPELAVIMGYAKHDLITSVLASGLPDEPALEPVLRDYFPGPLVERFEDLLPAHRLRRELIATSVANDLVNRMGVTFAFRLARETGRHTGQVVGAYWVTRQAVDADRLWRDVEQLGFLLGAARQLEWKRAVDELVEDLVRSYLRGAEDLDVTGVIERDRPVFSELQTALFDLGTAAQRGQRVRVAQQLVDDLVEDAVATRLACVGDLVIAPDVAAIRRRVPDPPPTAAVGDALLRLAERLELDALRDLLDRPTGIADRWERWQRAGLVADLRELRRSAVARALSTGSPTDAAEAVERYVDARAGRLAHPRELLRELVGDRDHVPLDGVGVAVRALREALELSP